MRQHVLSAAVLSLILVACGITQSPQPSAVTLGQPGAKPLTLAPAPLLGVYYGNQGWKMDQVRALETWSKKHAVLNLFTDWCSRSTKNLFGQQLPNVWNNQNIPLVTWEPFLCSGDSDNIESRIANGEFDSYILSWAQQMKIFLAGRDGTYGTADDRRVYLRLAHEMNGNWYRWGGALGGNPPSEYQRMWRRVHGLFESVLQPPSGTSLQRNSRLAWIWCVNHTDVGGLRAEDYFPGVGYVDWLAIDGYNWGKAQTWSNWASPTGTFGEMLSRVRQLAPRLPVAITEVATTTNGEGVYTDGLGGKKQWIADLMNYVVTNQIGMVVWFNEDKESDWTIFGGANGDETYKWGRTSYRAYKSYRTAVANLAGPDVSNPRLLTDELFVPLNY